MNSEQISCSKVFIMTNRGGLGELLEGSAGGTELFCAHPQGEV